MACPTKGDCYAAVWARRVVKNGGARPSQNTIDAAATFYNTLVSASLLGKIKALNFIAPDSIIAASTPFIKGTGFDPWTNVGSMSAAGNLTVNGMTNTGTSQYYDTGLIPNALFSSVTNGGGTVYISELGADTRTPFGCKNAANTASFYMGSFSSAILCGLWNGTVGQGLLNTSQWLPGYYSANRTASNAASMYYGGGTSAHVSKDSINTTGGSLPDLKIFVLGFQDFNGTNGYSWNLNRLSFVAFHDGLTQSESLAFFNAISALRGALGGGAYLYFANDDMESYTNTDPVNGLNGGISGRTQWNGAYVARTAYASTYQTDDMESYTDLANVNGLNGGTGWNGAYVARSA